MTAARRFRGSAVESFAWRGWPFDTLIPGKRDLEL